MRNNIYWLLAGIVIMGGVVYGRTLGNEFVGDDPGYINHPYIQHLQITKLFAGSSTDLGGNSPITGQFYRPVMLVLLSQIFQIAGKNPGLYHLIQLALHIVNALLVFGLLVKFFNKKTAWILSLIFLVHPINTETVAYISNLQDIMFVFFGLTAVNLLFYKKYLWMIPVCLFLALLSKETGILFSISVLGYMWIYRLKGVKQLAIWLIATLLVYAGLRFGVAGVEIGGISNTVMGNLSVSERIVQIPAIIWYYLKTFLWPVKLAIGQTWVAESRNSLVMLIPITTLTGITVLYILKKQSKTAAYFGLWLIMGLAMHLQIIPLEMTVADRWMYFSLIGVIGLIGQISLIGKKYILWGIILLFLAGRSWVRAGDYKDAITLYQHDTQVTESYLLEQAYGYELMQQKDLAEAGIHLNKSINLFENTTNTNTLGVWYFGQKDTGKAIEWFERSIKLGDNFQAYNNLARLRLANKETEAAKQVAESGTSKFPQSDNFWFLLALSEYLLDNRPAALAAAQKAVKLSPTEQNIYIVRQLQSGRLIQIND